MGIPAYFRWISEKYPRILVDCVEQVHYDHVTGEENFVDASAQNPNGVEYDNLYLDMNGIIHPCTHPEDGPAPKNEQEMFQAICQYIDRIFGIVRPRKLLYMAVDGVAPRAKINQQRSRRFRAAQEHQEKLKAEKKLLSEWSEQNQVIDEEQSNDDASSFHFDSNVITPGTPFMARLAIALRKYVAERIKNTPAWRDVVVVFSDASVPGEGEHKIAEFIRRERAQPGYDPSIRHVMYGLDADLIMLALATHEVNFTILREEVFPKRGAQRHGEQTAPAMLSAQSNPRQVEPAMGKTEQGGIKLRSELGGKKPFHFLHVHILREYLELEFKDDIENELSLTRLSSLAFDLERVIDDFVFMCFFVGNDFLPHLPTLDIREGAIDYLIELYKTEVVHIGYLTSAEGEIDFVRVRKLLQKVAEKEEDVFKERLHRERLQAERAKEQQRQQQQAVPEGGGQKRDFSHFTGKDGAEEAEKIRPSKRRHTEKKKKDLGYQAALDTMPTFELGRKTGRVFGLGNSEANSGAARTIKANLKHLKDSASKAQNSGSAVKNEAELSNTVGSPHAKPSTGSEQHAAGTVPATNAIVKRTKAEFDTVLKERLREMNKLEVVDSVKLGEDGWKDRYYEQKFAWGPNHKEEKMVLLRKYHEGLQWVMKYYYVGCISWGWFYPYHYAPFASDLVESEFISSDMEFEIGHPFEPFTQLQAVMPASSGKLVLPTCYSDLMVSPKSPIIDYYPEDFEVDLNGKRYAWQGVVLLPFIDELRLHSALSPLKEKLSEEERHRNSFGRSSIVIHRDSHLGMSRRKHSSTSFAEPMKISSEEARGYLFGEVSNCVECDHQEVLALTFEVPEYLPHSSQLLPGAKLPLGQLDDWTKSTARNCGWKQARFGPLGRAARDLLNDRQRRMSSLVRRNRGPTRGRRDSFQHDLPVINRPSGDVSSMFGGLGSSAPSLPRWVRGMHAKQTRRGGYAGGWGQGGQGVYGLETDPYRPASKDGGYYAGGGNMRHTPTAWGSGAGWQAQSQGRSQFSMGQQRDMRGPDHVTRQTYGQRQEHDGRQAGWAWYGDHNGGVSQHQPQRSGQYYVEQGGHYGNSGMGRQAGSGGRRGLSGPTAASMRRGRGNGGWNSEKYGHDGAY